LINGLYCEKDKRWGKGEVKKICLESLKEIDDLRNINMDG
jgi:hypothetical protein